MGGDFTNADGTTSTIDSPEAKAAYELYGRLIGQYGPDNVSTDMSWPDAAALFAQGQVAFYTDASSLYKNLADATPDANGDSSDMFTQLGVGPILIGMAVAAVSAAVAVKWLVAFLNKHGLFAFGWYRIVLGICLLGLALGEVITVK